MITFNSTLVVDLDELFQLIFPLCGLGVVHYISYHNTSTPLDLFHLILGNTAKRAEVDLRNVLYERCKPHRDAKRSTTYIHAFLLDNARDLV